MMHRVDNMDGQPEIRTIAAQPTMSIRGSVRVDQIAQSIGEYLSEVWQYVIGEGHQPTGQPYTRYHEIDPPNVVLEAGVPVREPLAPSGRIKPGSLPGGEAAVWSHVGPYEGLIDSGMALEAWVKTQGREAAGPNWEVYVTDPGMEKDPQKWRTDIYKPLRPAVNGR